MKKFGLLAVFMFGLVAMFLFQGCTKSKEEILNDTDKLYTSIKIMLTDEAVASLLSDEQKTTLRTVEENYLNAVQVLRDSQFEEDDKASLEIIADCADIILGILDSFDLPAGYDEKISAVRVVLKVIRVYLE